MKIVVSDERTFPTLGVIALPGDEVEVPDNDALDPLPVVKPGKTSVVKSAATDTPKDVTDNGSAPQ